MRAGLVVLCSVGLGALGCRPCFAGEYVLDADYSTSAQTVDTSSYWNYIPEDMTFEEWEEWEPTAGELRELMEGASPSEASPSSAGPSLLSSYPDVYDGSISTTQLNYFAGIVQRFSPGMHYVLFRQSRYGYRLVYGKELSYLNGVFMAPAQDVEGQETSYIYYDTEYNRVSDGVEGAFRLTPLSYPVYTDLNSKYPVLEGGRIYEKQAVLFVLVVMWLTGILSGFFIPSRWKW